jgi:YbbR domain-containing protein
VPIKLNLDLNFKKQYAIYDSIIVKPDSIIVTGANKLLKDIQYIETEKKSINNLSTNTELKLRLKNNYPKNLISIPDSLINVLLHVEKYTESVLELPVNLVNDDNNSSIKIFPDKINVTFLVAMKDYKNINKDEFTVVADYSKRISNSMKIYLLRYPSKIRITKIDPEKIEYILIK